MTTAAIRTKLHDYIDSIEEKKVKVIYEILQENIEAISDEYPDDLKKELDTRYEYYVNGGEMISEGEANMQIKKLMKAGKK